MDPATFNFEKVKALQSLGINRISLGVQSFDDAVLARCGRAHREVDILQALDDCSKAGITNFSIDLISALPHLTLETWHQTLHKASACGSTHISVYDLQIEERTAFGR